MLLSSEHRPQPEDDMDNAESTAGTAEVIEATFGGRWGVWLSETGRWWGARTEALTSNETSAGCVPFVQAGTPAELTARLHEQDALSSRSVESADQSRQPPGTHPDASADMTLDDLRHIYGSRWQIAPITGGYRAVIREPSATPIPRYGRTPVELAESIRHAERAP